MYRSNENGQETAKTCPAPFGRSARESSNFTGPKGSRRKQPANQFLRVIICTLLTTIATIIANLSQVSLRGRGGSRKKLGKLRLLNATERK